MPPPQVAVSHSSFFPTSFHDLLCPLLPTVSPVWNTFSSHPTGFKPPVIPTDFRPEHNKPRAAFCAQLYIFFFFSALHFCSWSSSSPSCLIFSIFKHSACLWVYLGIWGFLFQPFMWHCCMFGAEKVPQSTGLCLLPCLSSLLWVFTSSGDCAGRGGFGSSSGSCGCRDISRCELITHQLPGGLMSCQIFDEIDR